MRKLMLTVLISCSLFAHSFIPVHQIGFYGPTDPQKRTSNYPFISGDMFRAHADHVSDEASLKFDASRVQFGDTVFVNGNMLYRFISAIHPHIAHPYILITHNSDNPIPDYFYDFLNDPKLLCWFGMNAMVCHHEKIKPLPIGIENDSFGKTEIIRELVRSVPAWHERHSKAYVNFSLKTNFLLRGYVWQLFKDQNFCTEESSRPYEEYLQQMKEYLFVISPPGYGIDCHRHWEALLMGAIPIIQHSTIDELFDDLPVILVHEWRDVTPGFLSTQLQQLHAKKFNYAKLYADYWLDIIKCEQRTVRAAHADHA